MRRNMTIPKVSVIVSVYNVEPYLCRCLDSLINNSLDILKEYAEKDESRREHCRKRANLRFLYFRSILTLGTGIIFVKPFLSSLSNSFSLGKYSLY